MYGTCDETGVSLQPFRSVLGTCVAHAPWAILTAHVAHHGGELLPICPALAQRVETAPAPTATDDATGRFLAFEAAADLLRRIAQPRPLVLIVDDLQWAEPTALVLLRHLVRALADAPVLLVVSTRDVGGDGSEGARLTLADLDRQEARRLALTGLEPQELLDLVSESGPGDAGAPVRLVEALRARPRGIRCTRRSFSGTGPTPGSRPGAMYHPACATSSGAAFTRSATRPPTCSRRPRSWATSSPKTC